jgi:hypothetical protein
MHRVRGLLLRIFSFLVWRQKFQKRPGLSGPIYDLSRALSIRNIRRYLGRSNTDFKITRSQQSKQSPRSRLWDWNMVCEWTSNLMLPLPDHIAKTTFTAFSRSHRPKPRRKLTASLGRLILQMLIQRPM